MAVRAEDIAPGGFVDLDRDRLLVVRHQRGEDDAFDELYRRYHRRLVSYCQRRVGDRHTAEELAQEAFVRALRAMPSFAGDRHFYPWMTVIAGRLCIDHHRRSARVEPAAEVDLGSVEADHDALWADVDRHHLALAMDRLAPRHREILDLREGHGWSYQQIADHLEVPITTIEALLHRARKALRREYAAVAGEEGGGRWAAALGLGVVIARVRTWATALGTERWIPALATAAAGVGAAGLVLVPAQSGAATGPEQLVVEPAAATSSTDGPGVVVVVPPDTTVAPVVATTVSPLALPTTGAHSPMSSRPQPAAELGPVAVFADPAGQAYVDEQVEAMPVVVDLVLFRVGIDPEQLLGLGVQPATPDSGDQP